MEELGGPFPGWQLLRYLLPGHPREGSCRTHTHGKAFEGAEHRQLFCRLIIAPWRKAVCCTDFCFFLPLLPSPQSISGAGIRRLF